MNMNIMKSLLSIIMTLSVLTAFSQLENRSVNSNGGSVSSGGSFETIIVVGDPGASNDIGVAGSRELFAGFVPANFLGAQQTGDSISVTDSLALVSLYREAGGSEWTDNSGWLLDPITTWFGVGIDGERVVSLDLTNNNLVGFIPDSIGLLSALINLDLNGNNLSRDIPGGLGLMESLRFLNLSDNQLTGVIPDSLGLSVSLTSIDLRNNLITGEIPENITNISGIRELNLSSNSLRGTIPDSVGKFANIRIFDISNNEIEGELPQSINQFNSIDLFDVSNNLLEGALPAISGWSRIKTFNVSGNQLNGSIDFLLQSDSIAEINIANNRFRNLPDLTSLIFQLDTVDVSQNQLDFGDLEPNRALSNFNYIPQDSLFMERDSLIQDGVPFQIFYDVAGTANFYQWYKDGVAIDGETFDTYNIPTAGAEDEGVYVLEIGNDLITDLSLYTSPFELIISSRERDSLALVEIYNATGGPNWINNSGWLEDGVSLTDWFGVQLNGEGTRVIGLNLRNNNLTGAMPRELRFIGNLETVDIGNNELNRIPDLSRLESLTSIAVDSNRVAFASLYPNRNVQDFTYSPQKLFGTRSADTVQAGDDIPIEISVPGRFNKYQWNVRSFDQFLRPIRDTTALENGNLPFYIIEDIDLSKMGEYFLQVRNDSLPDLTISTQPVTVYASDNVFGTVFLDSTRTGRIDDGRVDLFRLQPPGNPYDSAGFANLNTNGEYILQDIILGDYILKVQPGDEFLDDVRQTFYIQSGTWQEADILFLRQKTEGINIVLVENPGQVDPGLGGSGLATGTLDEEINEEARTTGRVDARRRVRKAGCSLRRRVTGGGGRIGQTDEYVLIAYTETDENGEFSFTNLIPGEYRIDIQYPGVPMNEDSQIFFEVSEERSGDSFVLDAVITEDGIDVAIEVFLGVLKPYIKDAILYPNPTDGILKMDYLVYRRMNELKAQLLDLTGKVLIEKELPHQMGNQSMQLDMRNLESGAYLLRLQNGDIEFTLSYRIIKK